MAQHKYINSVDLTDKNSRALSIPSVFGCARIFQFIFIMWLFLESSCKIVESSDDVLSNDILSSTYHAEGFL
uniref:Uncharacterized protein n=1 Tax=Daphnia galeata TaxID=27404 RepID=A0A8J2RL48_9CRUS|nr:unnamed protein product [Daphnia galeata]